MFSNEILQVSFEENEAESLDRLWFDRLHVVSEESDSASMRQSKT